MVKREKCLMTVYCARHIQKRVSKPYLQFLFCCGPARKDLLFLLRKGCFEVEATETVVERVTERRYFRDIRCTSVYIRNKEGRLVFFNTGKMQKCERPLEHTFLVNHLLDFCTELGFPGGSDSKESACSAGDGVQSLSWKDPLEEEMATHSSNLAWRIPWTEEPDRLQSRGSKKSDMSQQLNNNNSDLTCYDAILNGVIF